MSDTKLVESLRAARHLLPHGVYAWLFPLVTKAADRIEALTVEVERRGKIIKAAERHAFGLLAERDRLRSELDKAREALGWFLADERFQVAVGGNPNVVNAMIAEARSRLTPHEQAEEKA